MPINPLEKLQTLRNINPLQTFYMGAKTHSKNVRFYWNVHLHLNKQAKVECKNRFEFGIQYPNEIYLPSHS
jgi:hypothetical protein